ncbi:Nn.00g009970.m01.CDS01 [Neocucurbitaria sp. VM-36]
MAFKKLTILAFVVTTSAHSWLHCTRHNNTGIRSDMEEAAAETPYREVDPLMPWFADLCHGWPRAKQNPGDWIEESSNYIWDLGLAASKGDTHACHPSQRTPTYHLTAKDPKLPFHTAPAPMATAAAGSNIKLMFGGNGHSRGDNVGGNGDPGRVVVYWKGEAEAEIGDV